MESLGCFVLFSFLFTFLPFCLWDLLNAAFSRGFCCGVVPEKGSRGKEQGRARRVALNENNAQECTRGFPKNWGVNNRLVGKSLECEVIGQADTTACVHYLLILAGSRRRSACEGMSDGPPGSRPSVDGRLRRSGQPHACIKRLVIGSRRPRRGLNGGGYGSMNHLGHSATRNSTLATVSMQSYMKNGKCHVRSLTHNPVHQGT